MRREKFGANVMPTRGCLAQLVNRRAAAIRGLTKGPREPSDAKCFRLIEPREAQA